MSEYEFADSNGNIVTEEYVADKNYSAEQVMRCLQYAFQLFPYSTRIEKVKDVEDVFHVDYPDGNGVGEIYICAKGTTPGGRKTLKDEQRIQPRAKALNFVNAKKEEGKIGVFLGVYERDDNMVFCTWKVSPSNTATPDISVSKQIKITSIAKAIKEGFVQQDKGHGEYACAFKPEFLYFYLRNCDWLHMGKVDELAEHTLPETENVNPEEQKERFRNWAVKQHKSNNDLYNPSTINTRISAMETGFSKFKKNEGCDSIFQIQDAKELSEYRSALQDDPKFVDYNKKLTMHFSEGLQMYQRFLDENSCIAEELCFKTALSCPKPRNRIIFGAPGTGKSYTLNKECGELLGEGNETDYERVTFHPDYSYANFVGTYKPVPCEDKEGNDSITYEYVPGPFMRMLVKALKNGRTDNPKPFLLIIEEINRADVAAVFGDVFQLLDRNDDNVSEYPIEASEDIKQYLAKELKVEPDTCSKICIPDNMFIWATMNSADQGVFPMDTAFKRRWDFAYLGIDECEKDLEGKYFFLDEGKSQKIYWNNLRKAINKFLADQGINEDKQLGPYFIARRIVVPIDSDEINHDDFIHAFKGKVLMYLFEDAARQKRSSMFPGSTMRYSDICKNFDEKGIGVFCQDIIDEYNKLNK